jgi:hypothetical protein
MTTLWEVAGLYGMVGVGCAAGVLLRRRGPGRWLDAALLLGFWPLHGPFLWLAKQDEGGGSRGKPPAPPRGPSSERERALLDALERAQGTPLASLLPEREAGRALARRLEDVASRVTEIDALLRQPDFSEDAALARQRGFEEAGDARSAAASAKRAHHIRHLKGLRDRYVRELYEVEELIAQLRIQAEVVRLSGAWGEDSRELAVELALRLEGLDAVLQAPELRV